jgi:hypothetical protein
MSGFQKFVNQEPAPGEPGDFAGTNPRTSVPSSPAGAYKVGTDPLIVGNFAWFNPATGLAESNAANGGLIGFVHRENQTIITNFLGESRLAVQAGFPVTGMSRGEFWASFPDGADVGDPVYANDTTGAPQVAAGGGTLTPFVVASPVPVPAVTDSDTTIAVETGIMTVPSALVSGVLEVGMVLTWAGQPDNARAVITAQLSATTWQTSYIGRAAVSATTVTGNQGTMAKISTWIE